MFNNIGAFFGVTNGMIRLAPRVRDAVAERGRVGTVSLPSVSRWHEAYSSRYRFYFLVVMSIFPDSAVLPPHLTFPLLSA